MKTKLDGKEKKGKTIMNMTITEFCRKHGACWEGMKWALKNCKDMNEVWQEANPDWVVWVATRDGVLTVKELRLFAVWSARQVQHLMTDARSIAALDVAERYANGNATDEELRTAWSEAREAARDVAKKTTWAAREATWVACEAASRACEAASRACESAWGACEAASIVAWDASNPSEAMCGEAWGVAWEARVVAREAVRAAQAEYLRQKCKPNFER